jgi:hypothetical protein
MKLLRFTPIAFLVVCTVYYAWAQEGVCTSDSRPDCPRAIVFLHRIQAELRDNKRVALANEIEYPLLAWIRHKKTHIITRRQFLLHFDEIFNDGVRCEILTTTDKDFLDSGSYTYGYSVKGGAIWFDGIIPSGDKTDSHAPDFWSKYPFKIRTINNDSAFSCIFPGKTP